MGLRELELFNSHSLETTSLQGVNPIFSTKLSLLIVIQAGIKQNRLSPFFFQSVQKALSNKSSRIKK